MVGYGTHESLLQASAFVETIKQRQDLKTACIEEVAYRMDYILGEQVMSLSKDLEKSGDRRYLLKIRETKNTNLV